MYVITDKKGLEEINLKRLKDLNCERLTLSELNLEDLFLTKEMHLIAPVKDKIISGEIDKLKIRSYLIYLSYLYNIDFLRIYKQDKALLWELISKIQISDNIKNNFYQLLATKKGEFFSNYLEELNNPEYRSKLREDQLILQRSVKS